MTKILVSACLLGRPVRYDGGAKTLIDATLERWRDEARLVSLCPEVAAGFPTPRQPAEIEPGKAGWDVMEAAGRVLEDTGDDVTEMFINGALIAVQTAARHGCRFALLTDGSPSCGSTFLYSGRFDGERRSGNGVVTQALIASGVRVFAEHQISALDEQLHSYEVGQ